MTASQIIALGLILGITAASGFTIGMVAGSAIEGDMMGRRFYAYQQQKESK